MRSRSVFNWLIFGLLSIVLILGVSNFQSIEDWLQLRNYRPSSRIVKLADETTMADPTRRVFYVNHPELDDKQQFNNRCPTQAEQTIVLGCFIERQGIYLLNVTDSRLRGVVEVTAAHETLHAMYSRLDENERAKVDKMTADFFATLKDERIKETIENYRSKDPGVVANELHSILGTEVRQLSPELENYYKRYFKDRSKIVDYSDQYEQTFIDIETKAKNYDRELASLKSLIDTHKAQASSQAAGIDAKQNELNDLLAEDKINEYNTQVPVYNGMVRQYNTLVELTKQEINQYNSLLNERNELVLQQQELYREINSNSINTKSGR